MIATLGMVFAAMVSCIAATTLATVSLNMIFSALGVKARGKILTCGGMKDNSFSSVAWVSALPFYSILLAMKMAGQRETLGIEWPKVCDKFCSYHKHPLNVAFHLLCTPLMVLGWMSACDALVYPGISYVLAVAYVGLLAFILPREDLIKSAVTVGCLLVACRYLEMGVAGIFFAGLNEVVTGATHGIWEPPYIASYNKEPWADFFGNLSVHYFLLLPLGQNAAARIWSW
eukprot:gnl/MRDRNA2_/MRDRNA2_35526_c0_seq1.p1 gnl/MRDRNA2_/MRDRNA2_35526_c0~~gnl/MRDRNA2_/MRDRNA2_35526_c0_seq1.p1  ORF type:complete len:230 (-),score=18.76 gnl/MRDRNA2_/MRDRNA2_35526_c0_seq1:165-854(-)